jgi:ABC-2 type transport system ATP-binding protein
MMVPSDPVIAVRELSKQYEDVLAVDRVEFELRQGEVFGFLGPNGAGKTTTLSMLTGLVRPTSGAICYQGRDVTACIKQAQHLMGIVPDESNLYPELTGLENLCFCGALYGMRRRDREVRANHLLHQFRLSDVGARKFATYSRGMKRKLTIAAALMHHPPVLFLDEPTSGIDVASARQIRQELAELRDSGTTVFLTTHYIEEAERLCDRIALIAQGRLVRVDTLAGLIEEVREAHVVVVTLGTDMNDQRGAVANALPDAEFAWESGTQLRVRSKLPLSLTALVRVFESLGVEVLQARVIRPSLEDVFVRLTGIERSPWNGENGRGGGES